MSEIGLIELIFNCFESISRTSSLPSQMITPSRLLWYLVEPLRLSLSFGLLRGSGESLDTVILPRHLSLLFDSSILANDQNVDFY